MKNKGIILVVFTILLLVGCASQKSETVKLVAMNCMPYNLQLATYSKYGKINISCYQISNPDSLTISSIKIINLDSLKSKINYPEIAKRASIEGNVLIEVRFNTNYEVNYIKALSNLGAGLEDSVLSAVKDFSFIFGYSQSLEDKSLLLIVNFSLENRQIKLPVQ